MCRCGCVHEIRFRRSSRLEKIPWIYRVVTYGRTPIARARRDKRALRISRACASKMVFPLRVGDWLCRNCKPDGTECGNINMSFRKQCHRCNVLRPDIEVELLRKKVKEQQVEIVELKAKVRSQPTAIHAANPSITWAAVAAPASSPGDPPVLTPASTRPASSGDGGDDSFKVALLAALTAYFAR